MECGLWVRTVLLRWNLKFQVFTAPGARLLHTFFAQMRPGQAPLKIFQGGGGHFNPQGGGGGLFRSNFNSKNHHFSGYFPVIFWYNHIMLLYWMTLTSNFIIYDHEEDHSISDVPKHSPDGGLEPPEFPIPLVKSSPLISENPIPPDGQKNYTFLSLQYIKCPTIVQDHEGLCVDGRILAPGIKSNCKSSNVIYLAQCIICDSVQDKGYINCYAGQTIQPLHKIFNGHRSFFNVKSGKNQYCPSMPMSLNKITSTSEILKLWPTDKDVQHP